MAVFVASVYNPFLHPDLVPGDQYVLVEGVRKVGLPAVAYVLVGTDELD